MFLGHSSFQFIRFLQSEQTELLIFQILCCRRHQIPQKDQNQTSVRLSELSSDPIYSNWSCKVWFNILNIWCLVFLWDLLTIIKTSASSSSHMKLTPSVRVKQHEELCLCSTRSCVYTVCVCDDVAAVKLPDRKSAEINRWMNVYYSNIRLLIWLQTVLFWKLCTSVVQMEV